MRKFHFPPVMNVMIEIYNEQVRDLLGTDASHKKLDIRNNGHNGFNVPDASVLPVNSISDVLDLMNSGQKNRTISSTALNDRSSRSHSVLTVHVQGTDCVSGCSLHSCLHLVDLAGSERVDNPEVTGDRLKEAQHINKSLSSLGDVIAALAQKNSHVPYRNSKLTQLLQDWLGGQAKTLMFVHISLELDLYGETLSTLKFSKRVATVELGAPRINLNNGKDQSRSVSSNLFSKKIPDEKTANSIPGDRNHCYAEVNRNYVKSINSVRVGSNRESDLETVCNGNTPNKSGLKTANEGSSTESPYNKNEDSSERSGESDGSDAGDLSTVFADDHGDRKWVEGQIETFKQIYMV
ncbi:hypothetical protein SUGI_0553570 [Cryptomeria japonica]|nr:hypothetical protein SUGI_0553570 [Cryptomeria japonica]